MHKPSLELLIFCASFRRRFWPCVDLLPHTCFCAYIYFLEKNKDRNNKGSTSSELGSLNLNFIIIVMIIIILFISLFILFYYY